jgi:outer membrane lipopolysaccharide assembly protein LptE/RlpB
MRGWWLVTTFLGCSLMLDAGCGYHLVGTSSFLPPELKSMHVEPFVNQTTWADIDQRLGEALTGEWVRRRRFELVDSAEGADLVLKGVISSIVVAPVTFDEDGRATEYQMTLRASVELYDQRGEEPKLIWEDKAFSRRTSYEVQVTAADYFDRQIEAMDELAREYSRALVSAVLEGF